MGKLTALSIKAATKPGRYSDGDGLYLVVEKSGSKNWQLRAQKDGKRHDYGLGSLSKVSLKVARENAAAMRAQIVAGIDPRAERRKADGIPTFREAAMLVHAERMKGWRNGKHNKQWISSLEAYAFPSFGSVSVALVDARAVRDVLANIWLTKPETARRVRQRIVTIIDWAVAKGYREASLAMPVIDKGLPPQRRKVEHFPSLPYFQAAAFLSDLRKRETLGRFALEAVMLTAGRSGELRKAEWPEINLDEATWTIPAAKMKANREHVVALSPQAVNLFRRMLEYRRGDSDLVFPGSKKGKPLSDMTLSKAIKDMHHAEVKAGRVGYLDPELKRIAVPHGFRATFRTWVAEETNFSFDLGEAAIAHAVGDRTVVSYNRGKMLEKRRPMMAAWANFIEGESDGNVVRIAR